MTKYQVGALSIIIIAIIYDFRLLQYFYRSVFAIILNLINYNLNIIKQCLIYNTCNNNAEYNRYIYLFIFWRTVFSHFIYNLYYSYMETKCVFAADLSFQSSVAGYNNIVIRPDRRMTHPFHHINIQKINIRPICYKTITTFVLPSPSLPMETTIIINIFFNISVSENGYQQKMFILRF